MTLAAESFTFTKPDRVDRDKAVVYGVRVLGPVSLNGGKYPESVIDRAKKLYDGAGVYIDQGTHQTDIDGTRTPKEKFGVLSNPVVKAGGLHCDLSYNPKHPFAEQFVWAAENRPDFYGFSHRAKIARRNLPDGTWEAEGISRVVGVDLVSEPATTATIFESKGQTMDNDPRMIAATVTDANSLTQWLSQFLDALPSGVFTNDVKAQVLTPIMAKYSPAEAAPADITSDAAMESLSRRGPLGKAAADKLREFVAESRKADAKRKAVEAADKHALPAHLRSDLFMGLIAESIGDEKRVKDLIDDKKSNAKPVAESRTATTTATNGSGNGTPADVKSIVAGYAAGR